MANFPLQVGKQNESNQWSSIDRAPGSLEVFRSKWQCGLIFKAVSSLAARRLLPSLPGPGAHPPFHGVLPGLSRCPPRCWCEHMWQLSVSKSSEKKEKVLIKTGFLYHSKSAEWCNMWSTVTNGLDSGWGGLQVWKTVQAASCAMEGRERRLKWRSGKKAAEEKTKQTRIVHTPKHESLLHVPCQIMPQTRPLQTLSTIK